MLTGFDLNCYPQLADGPDFLFLIYSSELHTFSVCACVRMRQETWFVIISYVAKTGIFQNVIKTFWQKTLWQCPKLHITVKLYKRVLTNKMTLLNTAEKRCLHQHCVCWATSQNQQAVLCFLGNFWFIMFRI